MNYLSLKYKLLIFSIGLSILLTVFLTIFDINYDMRKYQDNLAADLKHFEKANQSYLSSKLWTMEYDALKEFAVNKVDEKMISAVKIMDSRSQVIAEAREPSSKRMIQRNFELTYIHNGQITPIGKVHISGNIPDFWEVLSNRWTNLFVVNGFLVAVIFASSYLMIYRSVLKRLLNITRFTDQKSVLSVEGTGPHLSDEKSIPDEITRLVNSLNDRTRKINEEFSKRRKAEQLLNEKNKELLKEIKEKVQIQSDLKTSQQTFLSVLDGIDATIYVSDIETYEVLFMNRYMIQNFGGNMIGKKCWDVFRDEPGPCPHCSNDRILDENGKPSGVYVWQGKNPVTGRWYINYDRAIQWIDGRIVRLQIATDITDLKKMEEDLRQSHKMESVGTLAGGVAHDFNNILSIIIGNTELALEDVPNWNPAFNNLQEIKTASLRAREVIKQLLSYSRKSKEALKPVDIAPIVKESLKLIRSTIPSGIEIRDDIPHYTDTILADTTQINQVIINLCTNSAHAMPDEKGIIEISMDVSDIDRSTSLKYDNANPGRYLRLRVKDNGTGIDQTHISKVFDPYFTTKEIGKGTGMGLAVVHGIVKAHNGYVNIESAPGMGTSVDIYLPVSREKAIAPATQNNGVIKNDGSSRVLFIDDEKQIVSLAEKTLHRFGYLVTAETDPVQALRRFESAPDLFDVVVSDMTMPQMSGDQLAQAVRDIRKDIPIVICTGYSSLINNEKAKEMGINAFLMKPVSMKDLAETLSRVVNARK